MVRFAMFVLCYVLAGCSSKSTAEQEARQWAKEMGFDVHAVSCVHTDNDGDGYISCSLSVKQTDGSVEMLPIECAKAYTMNEGCRAPKVNLGRKR